MDFVILEGESRTKVSAISVSVLTSARQRRLTQGGYILVQRAPSFCQEAPLKVPHMPNLGSGSGEGRGMQSETWASGQETWAIGSSGPGWLCDPAWAWSLSEPQFSQL